METLHPVEAAWRQFRKLPNTLDLLAQCFEQREAYLRFLKPKLLAEDAINA